MTTQNCAECGTRAEPGQSFCDACGAVLGWDQGARATRPAGPPPHPHDAAPDTRTADGGPDTGPPPGRAGRAAGPQEAPDRAAHDSSRGPANAGSAEASAGTREVSGGTGVPAGAVAAEASAVPGPPGHAGDPDRPGRAARPGGPEVAGPAGPPRADGDGDGDRRPPGPAPAHPYAPAPGGPSPRQTAPTAPTPPVPAAPAPAPHALGDTMSDRARSLLVPVADPEAPHPAPAAAGPVLPGRPDADRPAVRAPGEQPGIEGGPPCRWCSTPNRPDRHYCVRCAMPLAETGGAIAPGRAPWWRRLFGGRRRETPWAGDRPRLRRVFDRIGTWITLAVVVTVAVLGFVYLPDGVRAALDHFAQRAPVAPDRIAASRSYPDHEPKLAFDKRSNTWWGPGVSQSGQGEWIEADFSEPTRLLDVIITPGVSAKADKIGESALPHHVTATITGKDGKVTTRRLTLDQGAGGQRRPFRVGEVTKVRFTVESSHAASADKQVALAEIEFFGPSNANRS
ncbi:zinc ribbon domain-containing protein [Streptomyces lavendulae subsp. lavendulae]|uniref:NADase-type glycan-binding domain-containing protein n=1 Tax=Streptomyces lavendulae TaxID=1914 RepID=UPI0024A3E592|nr:zinc ribbon domain-containing protein [Streptomyces lavendulae]GLV85923.1 zinc ribbon domain-containing protein [Streptomyces lavendulae subsp. lavendulae]